MEVDKTTGSGDPITVDVIDRKRNAVDKMELDPGIFGAPVKVHLLHEMVVYQEARHRAGTASTKGRGEVAGSNRKPYRQKGTGRARMGERTSPVNRGGGVIFGPKPRDFSIKVPKKVRKAALRSALSARLEEGNLVVVDDLKLDKIKTSDFVDWLMDIEVGENVLVVIADSDKNVELSARNLPLVKVVRAAGVNVRDVLRFPKLVLTRGAAEKIQEALS